MRDHKLYLKDILEAMESKEMAAMRDKLIHAYFGVDYPLVWKTIKKRIPKVKLHIQKILEQIQ